MYTVYNTTYENVYREWRELWHEICKVIASRPRPQRIIGRRRRYHDTTIPPLDFRSCSDAQFDLPNWVINMVHFATARQCKVRLDERAR